MQKQVNKAGIQIDAIVVANGSGPTHAGLALGAKMLGLKTRVIGINIGAYETSKVTETILETASGASRLFGTNVELQKKDVDVRDEYAGKGYGFPTKSSNNALRLVARKEEPDHRSSLHGKDIGVHNRFCKRWGIQERRDSMLHAHGWRSSIVSLPIRIPASEADLGSQKLYGRRFLIPIRSNCWVCRKYFPQRTAPQLLLFGLEN